jgi:23S rRNA pseudouridine1911/1915/1917 synthase
MHDSRELRATREQAGERLDRFLAGELPELTRSQIKRLIDDGLVSIAGGAVKAGLRLRGGEAIDVVLPEPEPVAAAPEAIPLCILYEDPHLVVLDKPAHMVVHPAPGHRGGALVNALLHHCPDLEGIGGMIRPGIVHRLDKDTSGVIVVAKTQAALLSLTNQFKNRTIHKEYLALVHGNPAADAGRIELSIGRHPVHRKKMSTLSRSGRTAISAWRVAERFQKACLLEVELVTGRTHQIRVHCAAIDHPVIGDPVYGNRKLDRELAENIRRQMLHAHSLEIVHPDTGNRLGFEAPIPRDMAELIEKLRSVS